MILILGGMTAANAQTSQTAEVRVKSKKKFTRSKLTVEFLSVLEDSRCPIGVDCIWAGNAKISVRVRKNGSAAKTFELNTTMDNQSVTYEGHTIKLAKLTPHPRANTPPAPNSYRATITISRQ